MIGDRDERPRAAQPSRLRVVARGMRSTAARLAAGLGGLTLAMGLPAAAQAATGDYSSRSFTQPAATGLTVTGPGPLSRFRAVSSVRVIVPTNWRRESSAAGTLRFLTPGTGCRYRVTFSVRTQLAAPGEAAARVDAALPSPTPARLLDGGVRGATAFRVIRPQRQDGRVQLRGQRTAVLTRRDDIVPAGQVAWSDVLVSAISRPGDECHAGTYRERMGPQLGDALATARTRLDFERP
jgi:hypothetical protein